MDDHRSASADHRIRLTGRLVRSAYPLPMGTNTSSVHVMADMAEIIDTGSKWARSARIVINAPAGLIFDVVADPSQHHRFDGSGMVEGSVSGPRRLEGGSRFGMQMRMKVPYRTSNEVVEFEDGRLIAWCHFNHHRWRYEFEPVDEHTTIVTETFDGSTARFPPGLLLINAYAGNQIAVAKTLVRLKSIMEAPAPAEEHAE